MSDPVFDYVPPGTPPLMNDRIEAAVEAAAAGLDAAAWDAMLDEQVRQLRSDPAFRRRYRRLLEAAGVDCVSPTVWSTDPRVPHREGVYRDLARWRARFETLSWLEPVRSPADLRAAAGDGTVGVLPNVQNLGAFTAGEARAVDDLYNAGVRIMQLTYNGANSVGAGCTEPADNGLSKHGRSVVRRLNELGAVVDLSHCGPATTLEAAELSDAPVAVTHSHCGALHDHPRATSDRELAALADGGGYFGVLVYPHHYDEPTFETFFEHYEHAVSVLGPDRVGVATDWGMFTPDVPESLWPAVLAFLRDAPDPHEEGYEEAEAYHSVTADRFEQGMGPMENYEQFPLVREAFERRGYADDRIDAALGGNFLSFWERVVDA